jgi:hypothetical protein
MVVAETPIPSLSSSPRIRMYPHRGFSLPSRITKSRISRSIGGLPGLRRGRVGVHRNRRSHLRSVSGRTRKQDQRPGGAGGRPQPGAPGRPFGIGAASPAWRSRRSGGEGPQSRGSLAVGASAASEQADQSAEEPVDPRLEHPGILAPGDAPQQRCRSRARSRFLTPQGVRPMDLPTPRGFVPVRPTRRRRTTFCRPHLQSR